MITLSIYLIISFIFLNQSVDMATIRKYFNQKDLSEYCKRRVVPSVFLGRHVVEAHSQILHFSRMDLPYSCFISVRAESGSSVMLVAQLPSDEALVAACADSPSQLLVYEMGETFGGYWGPLPDSVVRPEPTQPMEYTRATTERPSTRRRLPPNTRVEETTEPNLSKKTSKAAMDEEDEEGFINVIVPIVNVSGKLEADRGGLESGFDPDDIFDLLYDVTPRKGGVYHTSLLPIVQFSVQKSKDQKDGGFRYDLEYDFNKNRGRRPSTEKGFPLYAERSKRRKTGRTNYNTKNRKTLKITRAQRTKPNFRKNINASSSNLRVKDDTRHENLYKSLMTTSVPSFTSWDEHIQEIIHKLNKSSFNIDKYNNENENSTKLDVISDMKLNRSAYLIPDWNSLIDTTQNKKQLIQGLIRKLNESSTHRDKYANENKHNNKLLETIANMKHNSSVYLLPNWDDFIDKPYQYNLDIQELVQKLNGSTSLKDKYGSEDRNVSKVLDSISNANHNQSVYLLPDWNSFVNQIDQNHQLNELNKQFVGFTRKTLGTLSSFSYANKNIQQFFTPRAMKFKFSTKGTTHDEEIMYELTNEISTSTKANKQTTNHVNSKYVTEKAAHKTVETKTSIVTKLTTGSTHIQSSTTTTVATESISVQTTKPLKGSMVNHESWENVVQAAPVMAELLNQTVTDAVVTHTRNSTSKDASKTATDHNGVRVKRKIQPIPIEFARPHNRTTSPINTSTTPDSYGISDMQEFAQLVELQDDELHDRVALRYLRFYTGPMLFNICDYVEPNSRHVYLFNSSRVVLALHNFTIERMTVMLTPAWTLMSGVSQCSESSLECQVYGTRICIDEANACDGVPNCGAYDVYDEDRLTCGAADGLLHNVYLAAITFLAVMLTLIYTVHYWLRRCVPKVSEAFFIYTNGAENILYLESIMRSPHDTSEEPKMTYNAQLFEDDGYMSPNEAGRFRQSIFKRIIRTCFNCCKRKEKHLSVGSLTPKRMYSFAELELTKILLYEKGKEAGVQTGESLQLQKIEKTPTKKTPFQLKSSPERAIDNRRLAKVAVTSEDDFNNHANELNMLKLFKGLKGQQEQSFSRATATSDDSEGQLVDMPSLQNYTFFEPHLAHAGEEEEELQTHFYDSHAHEKPGISHSMITTTCMIHSERPSTSKQVKKCLRFEEEAVTIPSVIEEGDFQVSNDAELKDDDGINTKGSGGGRDFKRFWQPKKSKKKKTHLSLH